MGPRTELHKRKFGRRDTQKENTEKKNKELKIGVRGIALDKGKGKARQSWQNKRLSKTIKQNKNADAKIKGAKSITQKHCLRGEGRTYLITNKYARKWEDSEKRTKQKTVERLNIRKRKIAERKEKGKSCK